MQTTTLQLQLDNVARRVAKRLCTTAAFAFAAGRPDFATTCFSQASDLLRLTHRR